MFMSSLQNALIFTIHTIISTYTMIVLFRFLLQLVRAGFNNPLAQFAIKATNPLLVPLRRVIPGFRKIDIASIVLAILLQSLEAYLILLFRGFNIANHPSSIPGLFIWGFGEVIDLSLMFLFFIVLIQVIISWVNPHSYNPAVGLLESITQPLFKPVRRLLPTFGMLDFSPVIVIFLIYLCRMIIAAPITMFGKSLI